MFDFLIGNDLLSSLIAFGIVLIPAVIIHELGHFLAAKAIGITVLEFGVGFPPRAAHLFTWGETEFTLNWIPLGGFVRPLGEDMIRPLSEEETEQAREEFIENLKKREDTYLSEREELAQRGVNNVMSVNDAKPFPRIFFMGAGALANFISAFLMFVVVGFIGAPEIIGGRVGLLYVDPTSELAQLGVQSQDLIERVNGELFEDAIEFNELLESFEGRPITLTVWRPDSADVFETESFTLTDDFQALFSTTGYNVLISQIIEGSAAEGVLELGDMVLAVDGQNITSMEVDPISTLQDLTQNYADRPMELQVFRAGEILDLTVIPRMDTDGVRIGIGIDLGNVGGVDQVAYAEGRSQRANVPQSLSGSFDYGVERISEIFTLIAEFPYRLIQGATEPEERRFVSVVGVSQLGGQFIQDSIEDDEPVLILEYIALISIALGFTNLLPIPALDGGRILFVIIELVRGRPISPEREGVVHLVGLVFLLSIGIFFIVNDVLNPITNALP